ncbi:MAG: hypothetical protein LBU43_06740 [Candidatus Accumulibacter sp.]|jgi:hypothetical protein|nr:hypothetical protein [Accumulibacter sp.]
MIQKILTHPWIALIFLLILACLWLAALRRDRRDRDVPRNLDRTEKEPGGEAR